MQCDYLCTFYMCTHSYMYVATHIHIHTTACCTNLLLYLKDFQPLVVEFNRGLSVVRSPLAFHAVGTNLINLKCGNGPKSLSRRLKS